MKELGRKGGKASGSVKPEQVPASLREELRKLDPTIVRGAIEQALAGGNESARVSAVKLLADIDAFGRDREDDGRKADMERATAQAMERIGKRIEDRARSYESREVRVAMAELAAETRVKAMKANPDLLWREPRPGEIEARLEAMEEMGWISPASRVEELAEKKAQERLAALKQEHGILA